MRKMSKTTSLALALLAVFSVSSYLFAEEAVAEELWCKYQDNKGKLVFEGRCNARTKVFMSGCAEYSSIKNDYIINFSKSVLKIENSCAGNDAITKLNGVVASVGNEIINKRTFFRLNLKTDEEFYLETSSSKNEFPPWSESAKALGTKGVCYSRIHSGETGMKADCTEIESCGTNSESDEGGCSWSYVSSANIVKVDGAEESYQINGYNFGLNQISETGAEKCFPVNDNSDQFCFAKGDYTIQEKMVPFKIYRGNIIHPEDENNFQQFLSENVNRLIYIKSEVGYSINSDNSGFEVECKEFIEDLGDLGTYIAGRDRIFFQTMSSRESEIDCGDTVEIETRYATIGELHTGTGIATFLLEGFFEINKTGKWNDISRHYILKSRDVRYDYYEKARGGAID